MLDILITITFLLALAAVIWEKNSMNKGDFFPPRFTRARRYILNRSCGTHRLPIKVLDRMLYESNKRTTQQGREKIEAWFKELENRPPPKPSPIPHLHQGRPLF